MIIMKEHSDNNAKGMDEARGGKNNGFRKKNKYKKQGVTTLDDFFGGVAIRVGKEGPELYIKTKERLWLYSSAQFKNGSDVMECLKFEKVVKPEVPKIAEIHTPHNKRAWEYQMTQFVQLVLMSLCDSDTKNQVKSMNEFSDLEVRLDTIALLRLITKLIYNGGMNDLNQSHNMAMTHMNNINLHQDRFPDIQDFRAVPCHEKVFNKLGLYFGRYEADARQCSRQSCDQTYQPADKKGNRQIRRRSIMQ